MSFDLYLDNRHEQIAAHEEGIFYLIADERRNFPEINALWDNFYRSPKISAEQAHDLVHELIELSEIISQSEEHRYLTSVIYRLLPFFNAAYRSGQSIRCVSD